MIEMETLDSLLTGFRDSQAPLEVRLAEFVDGVALQASVTWGELANGKRDEGHIKYEELERTGKTALSESRYEDAVALFSAGTRLKPTLADAYFNLGEAWLKFALDNQKSDQSLDPVVAQSATETVETFLNFARDNFVIAYNHAKTAGHDKLPMFFDKLIEIYYHVGDDESIILAAAPFERTEITNPETLHLIGLAYGYGRKDWTTAERYISDAMSAYAAAHKGDRNPLYMLRMVEALSAKGEPANAILQLQQLNARLDDIEALPLDKRELLYSNTAAELNDALKEGNTNGSYNKIKATKEFIELRRWIAKPLGKTTVEIGR